MELKPRSGSTSDPVRAPYEYWQFDQSLQKYVRWQQGDSEVGQTYSHYNGFSIPGYHRRVRAGELLPHTSWEQYRATYALTGSIGPLFDSGAGGGTTDTWFSTGNYPILLESYPLSSQQLADLAPGNGISLVQDAAASIYSEGFDTLTFIAELADTKRMFFDAGRRLLNLRFPKGWRQMSNDWLSYRYGWRTFLYDCKSLHSAVTKFDAKRKRYSKRARDINSQTLPIGSTWTEVHAGTSFRMTSVGKTDVKISVVGTVNADISPPRYAFNPLVTAWEVIPYSFVIDWFISVGKALAAISFLSLQSQYVASWGYKIEAVTSTDVTGYSIKSGVTGPIAATHRAKVEYEVRVPCCVPLYPHFRLRMNTAKVIDLVGLIIQKTRRI